MGKAPAFQFYVKDWLSDPELRLTSLLSRGAWIDCLCFMWENSKRGLLTATPLKFSRLISGSLEETLHFLNEINEYEFGDIEVGKNTTFPLTESDCNTKVTIKNRRMYAEYKDKQNTRLRVRKHRKKRDVTKKKQKCNTNVTVTSPSPSPSPTPKKVSLREDTYCPHEKIIEIYHKKLPMLSIVQNHSEDLKKRLRARWREDPDRQNLDWWEWYFDGVLNCDFLIGKVKDWAASFYWLTGPKNMTKVLNGEYVNRNKGTKTDQAIEEFLNET